MNLDNPVMFAAAAWGTFMFVGLLVWFIGGYAHWEHAEAFGFLVFIVSLLTLAAVAVLSLWLLAFGG